MKKDKKKIEKPKLRIPTAPPTKVFKDKKKYKRKTKHGWKKVIVIEGNTIETFKTGDIVYIKNLRTSGFCMIENPRNEYSGTGWAITRFRSYGDTLDDILGISNEID